MNHGPRWITHSDVRRYRFAVLTGVGALLLNLLWSEFEAEPPVAPFLAAILLTGWYAGAGPVAVATVLSGLAYIFTAQAPYVELSWAVAPRLTWFAFFAIASGWFGASRRAAAVALQCARDELEQRVIARTAELRRNEQYLIAAQALSRTGSWALDVATGTVTWSEECARIFGRNVVAGHPRLLEIAHPQDLASAQEVIEGAVSRGESFETHFRIIRPNGEVRYVRSIGRPVVDGARPITEYVGVVIDVTDRKLAARRLRKARERSAETRFAAILDERARLAREMHDTLLQGFTGVGLNLVAVTNRVENAPDIVAALREVIASAQSTLENARRAIWDMRPSPSARDDFAAGLRVAAHEAMRGTSVDVEFLIEGSVRPAPPYVETALYRVMQEALANVVQHAAARSVRIVLAFTPKQIRLSITDDGQGFVVDPDFRAYGGHFGLLGIQERVNHARGTFAVRSAPTQGTEIEVNIPTSNGRTETSSVDITGMHSDAQPNSPSPNGE